MVFSAVLNLPVLAKVLGVLALIVLINVLIRSLLPSILGGSLVLGLWLGHPVATVARIAGQRSPRAGRCCRATACRRQRPTARPMAPRRAH